MPKTGSHVPTVPFWFSELLEIPLTGKLQKDRGQSVLLTMLSPAAGTELGT